MFARRAPRLAAVVLTFALTTAATPALALNTWESRLVSLANSARASSGERALVVVSDLASRAHSHSAEMAAAGRIFHSSGLPSSSGENVAKVHTVDEAHRLFMGSSVHRSNILQASFTVIGTGVVQRGEWLYVTELFQMRAGVAPRVTHRATRSRTPTPAFVRRSQSPAGITALAASLTLDMLREIVALDAGDFARS